MELDWHGDRSDLPDLALLDQLETDEPIDLAAVRAYRLGRVRAQMESYSLDACVLVDPVNIRYATGARNMQVFHARNPARYLFVPLSGPVVLYEFTGCAHLAEGLETIDEIRPAITASYAAAGGGIRDVEATWARQVASIVEREQPWGSSASTRARRWRCVTRALPSPMPRRRSSERVRSSPRRSSSACAPRCAPHSSPSPGCARRSGPA
jgi:hypothetical protein